MEQTDLERIQRELDDAAKRLFPGPVERGVVLQYGDDPIVEPGEIMVRLIISPQGSERQGRWPAAALGEPEAMKEFQRDVSLRLPGVQRIEVISEDADGKRKGALLRMAGDEPKADSDFTPVMVRMRPPELEIVDTLISVGIVANRAEAVRWALARISERPAYGQLRERTLEIERLKSEF